MNRSRRTWIAPLVLALISASLLSAFPHGHDGFSRPAPDDDSLRIVRGIAHAGDLCALCVLGQHVAGTESTPLGRIAVLENEGSSSFSGVHVPDRAAPADLEARGPPLS